MMSTDRFHKAAKDGLLEVLKEATRRDCNGRDEQGMTPTLYAAFYGNLEALRLLCGRGGDPDKSDVFGNSALHLAAAQGHKHIVTFLVNFGANIYAVDIDGRTAQELAGMNNRDDILRFLDGVHAKLEATDKKKAKTLKEKAKKESEKRLKEYNRQQAKKEMHQEKLERKLSKTYRPSVIETLKYRIKSGSMSNLSMNAQQPPRNSFSAIVGMNGTVSGTRNMGSVQKKILNNKQKALINTDDDFKISEMEDGKRSVRSLKGYRRDSEVLYGGTIEKSRGRLDEVFVEPKNNLVRSASQPDFIVGTTDVSSVGGGTTNQEPASIFVRPGIGSLAFRRSITNTFQGFHNYEMNSLGSGGGTTSRTNTISTEDEFSDNDTSEDEETANSSLERFLAAWGLQEYFQILDQQKIDLDTLMLLTENDLKSLNLPLGPYRKLVTAINERRKAFEINGTHLDQLKITA